MTTRPGGTAFLAVLAAAASLALLADPGAPAAPRALPTARLSWSVPPRYPLSWHSYYQGGPPFPPTVVGYTQGYFDAYVHPASWTVDFDLCGSSGAGRRITRYDLSVEGVGFEYRRRSNDGSCKKRFDDLPRLGTYAVAAAVETAGGGAPVATFSHITLHDWLIVSLGDSFASGEGSPDTPGSFDFGAGDKLDLITGTGYNVDEIRPDNWKDVRCHRSALSGHALLAQRIEEEDPHSSVTFVSLSCSGAEIDEGVLGPYAGMVKPPGRPPLPAQVDALRQIVGKPPESGLSGPRPIDALLLEVGINDVHFSDIVKSCSTNPSPPEGNIACVIDTGFSNRLARLRTKYDRLGRVLHDRFPGTEVYIADYPGKVFAGGGCGLLGLPGVGITASEGEEIAIGGTRLAGEQKRAAFRWDWNYVGGVTEAFEPHAYCSGSSWFTHIEESYRQEGSEDGTAHPTPDGHQAFADALAGAVVVDRSTSPSFAVRLVVERARVGRSASGSPARFSLAVPSRGDGLYTQTRWFTVPSQGSLVVPKEGPRRSTCRSTRAGSLRGCSNASPSWPEPPARRSPSCTARATTTVPAGICSPAGTDRSRSRSRSPYARSSGPASRLHRRRPRRDEGSGAASSQAFRLALRLPRTTRRRGFRAYGSPPPVTRRPPAAHARKSAPVRRRSTEVGQSRTRPTP